MGFSAGRFLLAVDPGLQSFLVSQNAPCVAEQNI